MNSPADGGEPFVRNEAPPRNWMRAAAPGIAFRFPPDESSPIGSEARAGPQRPRHPIRSRSIAATVWHVVLVVAGTVSFGNGVYIYAKAQLAQVLLHRAWDRRATGSAVKPWPWADTHPIARLIIPARAADILVLAGASGRTLAFGPG